MALLSPDPVRVVDKGPDAFRTISEVAEDLDLPQHVLRFWETRFGQIKPLKRGGGRRYYRPDDVELLRGIRHLLYGKGYTIKGVQRILKEDGLRFVQSVGRGEQNDAALPPPAQADADEEPYGDRGLPGSDREDVPDEADEPSMPEAARAPHRSRGETVMPFPARTAGLSGQDIAQLRAALEELAECERVLAALRGAGGFQASDDEG